MGPTRYSAQDPPTDPPEPVGAWTTSLTAVWETDPGIIATVLPRPLEATEEPLVRARVSRVEFDAFTLGASVHSVRARHGDVVGWYDLTMCMDAEAAVVRGREMFGEPKKLGDIQLSDDGDQVSGRVTRNGITYLELRGRIVEDLPLPPDATRTSFYFKFLTDPGSVGFDSDPSLVYCHRAETWRSNQRVDGEVLLTESPFDPVIDLPVRMLASFTLEEHNTKQWGEIKEKVPAEHLLPFVHQRYDSIAQVSTPAPA